ncbi:hypothetical protein GCM10010160_60700 [Acrocarpospora corrugata]
MNSRLNAASGQNSDSDALREKRSGAAIVTARKSQPMVTVILLQRASRPCPMRIVTCQASAVRPISSRS